MAEANYIETGKEGEADGGASYREQAAKEWNPFTKQIRNENGADDDARGLREHGKCGEGGAEKYAPRRELEDEINRGDDRAGEQRLGVKRAAVGQRHGSEAKADGGKPRATRPSAESLGKQRDEAGGDGRRSEEHTSELQSRRDLVCR